MEEQGYTQVFSDSELAVNDDRMDLGPLLSGGEDATGSIESVASSSFAPAADVSSGNVSVDGPRVSRHSVQDKKDLLYCFLWAKNK